MDAAAKDAVTTYFDRLATAELTVDEPLTFESKWTPVKRLNVVRDSMPEEARSSTAWTNTLPASSEVAATELDEPMWTYVCSASQSETGLEASCWFSWLRMLAQACQVAATRSNEEMWAFACSADSVGNGTWSVLLICLAPRSWGNVAAHKEISRVWLLIFYSFVQLHATCRLRRKKHRCSEARQSNFFNSAHSDCDCLRV